MVSFSDPWGITRRQSMLITAGRDNEKPQREAQVHAFQAQGRAITNEEARSPNPMSPRLGS
jgi:hypothetical protein